MLDLAVHEHFNLLGIHAEFLEDEGTYVLRLLQYAFQYMYRLYHLLTVQLCCIHSLLYGLLGFDGKLV